MRNAVGFFFGWEGGETGGADAIALFSRDVVRKKFLDVL